MNEKKPAKKKTAAKKKPKKGTTGPSIVISPSVLAEPLFALMDDAASGGPDAVTKAQMLMYDAWEAPTRRRAVALAKKALSISSDCADAYNLLAEETAQSIEESLDLYTKALEAGERALGKRAFKEDVGYFWGILETRPYMRARAGLADCLWEAGRREEAVAHYQDMLRLNPNDNQGIRDRLMPCLIEFGRDKDAEKLFKKYKNDGMATWMYSRALLDFRNNGDSSVAEASLRKAIDENKHVPPYLLGRKKMPRNLPDHYGFGDDNEAVIYVHENKAAWQATPGALEWLAEKLA